MEEAIIAKLTSKISIMNQAYENAQAVWTKYCNLATEMQKKHPNTTSEEDDRFMAFCETLQNVITTLQNIIEPIRIQFNTTTHNKEDKRILNIQSSIIRAEDLLNEINGISGPCKEVATHEKAVSYA